MRDQVGVTGAQEIVAFRCGKRRECSPQLLDVRGHPPLTHVRPDSGTADARTHDGFARDGRTTSSDREGARRANFPVPDRLQSAGCGASLLVELRDPAKLWSHRRRANPWDDAEEDPQILHTSLEIRCDSTVTDAIYHRIDDYDLRTQ